MFLVLDMGRQEGRNRGELKGASRIREVLNEDWGAELVCQGWEAG